MKSYSWNALCSSGVSTLEKKILAALDGHKAAQDGALLRMTLKEHYYGKTNTGNQRQSYKRARDGLLNKGEMAINEGFCG